MSKSNVGRKPVFDKIADRLEDLVNYASQGLENKVIAEMLGISESSFYKLMLENKQFNEAYQKGLDNRKYELEKALFKRAEGFTAEEKQIVRDADGNVVKETVTEKHYIPDTTALIFSLKNLYGEKYKDRVETKLDINVNLNQIEQLSDEELQKLVSQVNVTDINYQIE